MCSKGSFKLCEAQCCNSRGRNVLGQLRAIRYLRIGSSCRRAGATSWCVARPLSRSVRGVCASFHIISN
eukprot:6214299-Pleurochrysis_carterae.AAC.3